MQLHFGKSVCGEIGCNLQNILFYGPSAILKTLGAAFFVGRYLNGAIESKMMCLK